MADIALGVDIGGTFTDCVALGEGGRVAIGKALSTPPEFDDGFLDAIEQAAHALGEATAAMLARADRIYHGCTVGSNALVQRRTAKVGLLTTRGHRDSLFTMRSGRRLRALGPQSIAQVARHVKPEPIVSRSLVRELDERVALDGSVLVGLDEGEVAEALADLIDAGAEALAVSLLWSIANNEHERLIARVAEEIAPDMYISVASRVAPRSGEYERTVATVINSLIGPEMDRYLSQLESRCAAAGYDGSIRIMTCSGGLISTAEARALPLLTIGSGPVAGLIGAGKLAASRRTAARSAVAEREEIAAAVAEPNVITADMGGTTLDVGVIRGGAPLARPTSWYEQYEYFTPTLDVRSVGSGGGSIVRFDKLSCTLRVGPESAGSRPGPVCYGRGGSEPTITDADLVAGFLNPERFLGGKMRLDLAGARDALARVGRALGLDAEQTALAALRIVDNQMADAIRLVSVNQGLDPRQFTLYACGGAGAVHAAAIAGELGIGTIVVPLSDLASGWSAFGVAGAEPLVVEELAMPLREPFDGARLEELFAGLEKSAAGRLLHQGLEQGQITLTRHADMRYSLQVNEIEVPAPADGLDAEARDLIARFESEYTRRYGRDSGYAKAGYAITGLRVRGSGPEQPLTLAAQSHAPAAAKARGTRRVIFHGRGVGAEMVSIHGEEAIHPGSCLDGPAIVELPDTSIVVPHGARMQVDPDGSARIALEAAGDGR